LHINTKNPGGEPCGSNINNLFCAVLSDIQVGRSIVPSFESWDLGMKSRALDSSKLLTRGFRVSKSQSQRSHQKAKFCSHRMAIKFFVALCPQIPQSRIPEISSLVHDKRQLRLAYELRDSSICSACSRLV